MKKCYITVLSGILAGLLILSSCDNFFTNESDSAEPSANNPALSESGGAINARIFLPDYHKLAAQQSRVIAPQTAKVRLSIGSGSGTITWTQHGEDLAIDWDELESVEGAPADLPGGIWTAQFLALKSGEYKKGALKIELLDSANQVITQGYNEETLVITTDAAASAQFFTTPVVHDENAGSLRQGEMRFWRISRMAYAYKLTLTATGSWPDIVFFNNNGTFDSYHSISGTGNNEIILPMPEESAFYYIGVWADAGAVTSYNLAFEFNLEGWTVTASGSGATPPAIVTDTGTGKKVIEFNARPMYSGGRASISRTIETVVPMGLSFSIKTDISANVSTATAMVFYIDDIKMASWNGVGGDWVQESFIVEAGVHVLKWALEKDSNAYSATAANNVLIDDVSLVPDVTDSVVIYPRADQDTYTGGFGIQYTAQALRSDGSVRSNATGFSYSGSGSGGSVNSAGLFSPGSAGTYTVSVTQDGKTASGGTIKVHAANYLRQPYTYPGTGKTYTGYSGSEGSRTTTSGGVTVTYPAESSFSADGFFTLEGSVNNSAVYNYALIKVAKGDLETSYMVRDTFKTRIWLRFGAGSYTVSVYGLSSITLSSALGAEGDYGGCSYYRNPVTFTVTNTRSEAGRGETADMRFLYPSSVVQSDDFRITNLAAELGYGLYSVTDKARAIHDYLVSNTVYDADSLNDSRRKKQDALTVLGTRYFIDNQYPKGHFLAVCEGYANTSAALLRAAGIESKYIGSEGMMHAWNNVYVDGAWKFYDATWDDPVASSSTTGDYGPDYIKYTYFLLSSLTGVDGDHYDGAADPGRYAGSGSSLPRQKGVPDGWY